MKQALVFDSYRCNPWREIVGIHSFGTHLWMWIALSCTIVASDKSSAQSPLRDSVIFCGNSRISSPLAYYLFRAQRSDGRQLVLALPRMGRVTNLPTCVSLPSYCCKRRVSSPHSTRPKVVERVRRNSMSFNAGNIRASRAADSNEPSSSN